jgi:hypothetical protein
MNPAGFFYESFSKLSDKWISHFQNRFTGQVIDYYAAHHIPGS